MELGMIASPACYHRRAANRPLEGRRPGRGDAGNFAVSPHPPILSRPRALWRLSPAAARPGWREICEAQILRAGAAVGPDRGRAAQLFGYRPDLLAQIGPAAWRQPALRAAILRHPACAVALLCRDYEATAAEIEPSLRGSGEAVFHLLGWAGRQRTPLRQPESFYRRILVQDSYWGIRQARQTRDARLLGEVAAWSADERHRYAAAAAVFLMRHPREPVEPYREILVSNPLYAYWSLPRLHPRGFTVRPEELRTDPKWSCHFALSCFSREPRAFEAAVATDPAWLIELAAARGWLSDPGKIRGLRRLLAAKARDHPLLDPAMGFLGAGAPACAPAGPRRPARRGVPDPLTSGQAAETRALSALRMRKNTEIWRPSSAQIESSDFKQIVGPARYTDRGFPRGTVVDSVETGFAEIKSGRSVLKPTYQLRLQTYRAVAEERAFKIYTNRPVDIEFGQWLGPWGVEIRPLPEPQP
jgi:hypothetical protein